MQPDAILSVAEYNQLLAEYLADLGELVVEGEISQPQISQGKWFFCTLKDSTSSMSIFAPMWKISNVQSLTDGMLVKVRGAVSIHQKSGRLSFTAFSIEPSGEGALRRAYELLKKQLAAEGLFDSARKRPLPKFPEKIGLITAIGARAYSDFLRVLNDRMGGLTIQFYPVQVQGRESVDTICQAFDQIAQNPDPPELIILTRGGGSLEDLLSFNDERVARAVFACKVPVVSAIGHELDVALTDLVADVRAATPTHAAELVMPEKTQVLKHSTQMIKTMASNLQQELVDQQQLIQNYTSLLESWFIKMRGTILEPIAKLHLAFAKIESLGSVQLQKVKSLTEIFITNFNQELSRQQTYNQKLNQLLNVLDPLSILARGFSIVCTAEGKIARSITDIQLGEKLKIQLAQGKIEAVVTDQLEVKKGNQ